MNDRHRTRLFFRKILEALHVIGESSKWIHWIIGEWSRDIGCRYIFPYHLKTYNIASFISLGCNDRPEPNQRSLLFLVTNISCPCFPWQNRLPKIDPKFFGMDSGAHKAHILSDKFLLWISRILGHEIIGIKYRSMYVYFQYSFVLLLVLVYFLFLSCNNSFETFYLSDETFVFSRSDMIILSRQYRFNNYWNYFCAIQSRNLLLNQVVKMKFVEPCVRRGEELKIV